MPTASCSLSKKSAARWRPAGRRRTASLARRRLRSGSSSCGRRPRRRGMSRSRRTLRGMPSQVARHRQAPPRGAAPRRCARRRAAAPSSTRALEPRKSRSTCSDCSAHLLCRCAVLPGCATSAWCVFSHCAHTRARPRCCHRPTTRRRSKSSRARCCAVCIAPSAHFDCTPVPLPRLRPPPRRLRPARQRARQHRRAARTRPSGRAAPQRPRTSPPQRPRVVLVQRLADGARSRAAGRAAVSRPPPGLRE